MRSADAIVEGATVGAQDAISCSTTARGRALNRRLQELTNLSRSQVKSVLGLIAMRNSGNGNGDGPLWGKRNGPQGPITRAFGIDLSPLAARYEEFAALVDEDDRRRAQAGLLRADISAVRRAILTLADRGMADAPDWPAVALRARQLATGCAAQPDPEMLSMVLSQMRAPLCHSGRRGQGSCA